MHLMDLKTLQREMISLNIPSDAAVAGKPLSRVELPPNSIISLVVKGHGPFLPSDDLVLDSGDDVVAVTSPEEEQLLYQALTGVE